MINFNFKNNFKFKILNCLKINNWKLKISVFAESGLGMIEMLVVLAVLSVAFMSMLQLATLERRTQIFASEEAAAYILAREALEAARSTRDENWTNLSTLAYGIKYYPQIESDKWVFQTINPGPIGVYAQWIEASEVLRDASDNIAESGVSDEDSKKITAYVKWTRLGGEERTIELETYLTNWQTYK